MIPRGYPAAAVAEELTIARWVGSRLSATVIAHSRHVLCTGDLHRIVNIQDRMAGMLLSQSSVETGIELPTAIQQTNYRTEDTKMPPNVPPAPTH